MGAGCKSGDPYSCNELAALYASGEGAAYRPQKAREMFKSSCDAEVALACERLADMYAGGVGGKRNPRKAAEFRERACKYGRQGACVSP